MGSGAAATELVATLVLATGCGRIEFVPLALDATVDAAEPVAVVIGDNTGDTIANATRDVRLTEASPDDGGGGCDRIRTEFVGTRNTVLFRFDVSQLPAGTIVDASLALRIADSADANIGTMSLRAFRVVEAWSEGSECSNPGDASWNERMAGIPWSSPGAADAPSIDVSELGRLEGPLTYEQAFEVPLSPSVIVRWLATPAENHGIALLGETTDAAIVYSRSAADGKRPRLRVTLLPQ